MTDNLYKNTMAFTGAIPWHHKGVQFGGLMAPDEAFTAAELDFKVGKEPVYRMLGGVPVKLEGRNITVNLDTQDVLGYVGDRYEILQNEQAKQFIKILCGETGAVLETAGAIGKGEKVWMMARLPDVFFPLVGDEIKKFLLMSWGHDGEMQFTTRFTPVRTVCQNTLTAAIRGAREFVAIRHTASVGSRVEQAAIVLKEMNAHFNALGETFTELAHFRIDDEWLDAYMLKLFGPEPKQDAHGITKNLWAKKTEAFDHRMATGMGLDLPGVKGTAWAAYNAAVEMADYEPGIFYKKEEARTESILWGRANDFKQGALESALALVRR